MPNITLTDHDVHGTLLNALSCAVDSYRKIAAEQAEGVEAARMCQDSDAENMYVRLADQFNQQALDAEALYARIERACMVQLVPYVPDEDTTCRVCLGDPCHCPSGRDLNRYGDSQED